VPPTAREPYRGQENQLYRVEVHTGGPAWPDADVPLTARRGHGSQLDGATFKWSRENGSVVFPVESVSGAVVTLAALGRDRKVDLEVGDWVEVVDESSAARVADDLVLTDPPVRAPRLRRVRAVDPADRTVTLDGDVTGRDTARTPLLRRWDHGSSSSPAVADDGAVPVREGDWLDLEDGVQVYFEPGTEDPNTYRRGDYWLIPARTATGDVEWPADENGPAARLPHGVPYRYAPLAFVSEGTVDVTPRVVFGPPAAQPVTGGREIATVPPKSPAPRRSRRGPAQEG
jgi:hypothetical protein